MSRRKPGPYPPPFDQLPAAAAELAMGLGGGAGPQPAPRYNSGMILEDGTGEYPKDGEGYYVSRTTGDRLSVDAAYSVGDDVGAPRMYTAHGIEVGTLVGVPGSSRRNGFTASAGNYGKVTFSTRQISFIGRMYFDGANFGSFETVFNSTAAGPNVQLYGNLTVLRARIWDGASTAYSTVTIAAAAIGAGWRWIVATYDALAAGAIYLAAYDDLGALISSGTNSDVGGALDVAKEYGLGASPGAGGGSDLPWPHDISCILGLDGAVLSAGACAAIVADLAGGTTTIDDYAGSFSLPTDGLICGTYDPAAPTVLPTTSGTGATVTVEQP